MSLRQNIQSFIPVDRIVKRAITDMYGDFEKDQARFRMWAIDGLKKLTRQTLRSGKRYVVLNINKNLNSAVLPCDFKEEIVVAIINNCGEKIKLNINPNIVNNFAIPEEIPCDTPCEAKCGCLPKQLCADLQTTQVINKILINDTEYDQTVTTTLLPNGEYYQVTTTPILDTVSSTIIYKDTKEYITTFDTATCGCIKPTDRNAAKLECLNWDAFCCYCTTCHSTAEDFGGYKIFLETGTIHFDGAFIYDKCYIEYRGSMPKVGNEYLVPEVAYDTLTQLTKYYSIQNKKGVPRWERLDQFEAYRTEYGNMKKIIGRISLADILQAALLVPKFDINSNGCYIPCTASTSTTQQQVLVRDTVYVNVPTPAPPQSKFPTIITFEGSEIIGGIYSNATLAPAVSVRVFANPLNRFLVAAEYSLAPNGDLTINTGGTYGAGDWFDVFPKWQ